MRPTGRNTGWEERIAAAAGRAVRGFHAREGDGRREAEATLFRLGFPLGDVEAALAGCAAARLLASMHEALRRDLASLGRLARTGHPLYDLNRHIAAARASRFLGLAPSAQPSASRGGARRRPSASASASIAAPALASMRR